MAAAALGLTGCAPTVNLATPKPVTVDVNVKLDVYQKTAPSETKNEQTSLEVAKDRRLRAGEVQQLKNDHVIGENRYGYLEIRELPKDPKYAEYAKKIVTGENADRAYIYLASAQTQNKPFEVVEQDYAKLWRDRAFPGEWIQKDDGTWIQK